MTDEEWKAHVQQWQGRGEEGGKTSKPDDADPSTNSDGGWLDSAGAFGKGMLREGAKQIGVAKDFAEGNDPEHSTAEGFGRAATDIAPSVALDVAAPELGLGSFLGKAALGGIGGAIANPNDRWRGAKTGALTSSLGSVGGRIMSSPAGNKAIYGAAGAGELARMAGMIPHMPWISPWILAHGMSALAGLAKAAGYRAPAATGAVGSKVQQELSGDQ